MTDAAPGTVSRLEVRVRYAETDQMGVVHHPRYYVWFENGRIDLLHLCGLDYATMERRREYFPVVTCAARYSRPARFDDRLVVDTVLLEAENNRLAFGAWIFNLDDGGHDAGPICKLHSVHAYAREALSAQPVPDDVLSTLRPHLWTGSFFGRRRRPPPGF